MVPPCKLDELPTELLLQIFSYLDVPDLCRVRQSCRRFNEVIHFWGHFILKDVTPLVTNQMNPFFLSKCLNKLTIFEKCRISHNWHKGKYKETSLLYTERRDISWLHLTNKSIWINRGRKIFNYRRDNNKVYVDRPICSISGRSRSLVEHFQLKDNLILCGQRDGSMWLRSVSNRRIIFDVANCHDSNIMSVDICPLGNYIVSGSVDKCFKIWKFNNDYVSQEDGLKQTFCHEFEDEVCKVSILDGKSLIAVGTSGINYRHSLFVYDLQRLPDSMEFPFLTRHEVSDLIWDGPHSIWTCGTDKYLKRFDLRTGNYEQAFSDWDFCGMSCLDFDYFNTIMVGVRQKCAVILLDIRAPSTKQVFYMEASKNLSIRRSPISSLAFDAEFLFAATHRNLNVLKFSGHDEIVRNYSI